MRSGRAADLALLVSVFTITLVRLRWSVGGGNDIYLSDMTVAAFLGLFLVHRLVARDRNVPRTVVVLLAFLALLSVVYLVGYFDLETSADRSQYTKGLAKFALHFAFLIAAVAHLSRRSTRFYWQTLGAFVAGMALNGAYAVLEFLYAMGGRGFLDPLILGPITGDRSEGIFRFGVVAGVDIYRSNGLMLDVNHLGVALIVPILILLPLYLRLERGHRMRLPLVLTLAVLALAEVVTFSRSGALGLIVGLLVLAVPYRRLMVSRRLLVPVGALAGILLVVSLQYSTIVSGLLRARTSLSGRGTQTHFDLYELLPPALDTNPLFGRGLNTFSTYFEFPQAATTGARTRTTSRCSSRPGSSAWSSSSPSWSTSSAVWASCAASAARSPWRATATARVQPLAWGLTAALAGTLPRTSSTSPCRCTTSSSSCSWPSRRRSCSPADEAAGVRAGHDEYDRAFMERMAQAYVDRTPWTEIRLAAFATSSSRGRATGWSTSGAPPARSRTSSRRSAARSWASTASRSRSRPPRISSPTSASSSRTSPGSRSRTTRRTRLSRPTWWSTSTTRRSPGCSARSGASSFPGDALPLHAQPAAPHRAHEGARSRGRAEPNAHRPPLRAGGSRPGSNRPAT